MPLAAINAETIRAKRATIENERSWWDLPTAGDPGKLALALLQTEKFIVSQNAPEPIRVEFAHNPQKFFEIDSCWL